MNRRNFLKTGLGVGSAVIGSQIIPGMARRARAEEVAEDHLYVQIQIQGSMDMMESIDPKLSIPGASEEDFYKEYTDNQIKGEGIRVAPSGYPLLPYLKEMVVINGLHMDNQDTSHEGCRTYAASGAAGQMQHSSTIIEIAANSGVGPFGVIGNAGDWLPNKRGQITLSLTETLEESDIDPNDPRFFLTPIPETGDPFLDSLNAYINSVKAVDQFNEKLSEASETMGSGDPELDFDVRIAAALASGLGKQGFINLFGDIDKVLPGFGGLDTHSGHKTMHAASQTKYWEKIAKTFEIFKKMEYKNSGSSVFDKTTFLITNEFSKTPGLVGDGKDHNPQTNSTIIAGRGVKGDQVIGRSRFFSKAELPIVVNRSLLVGMPLDFTNGITLPDDKVKKLEDLHQANANVRLIKPENVIATLLDIMNIPQTKFVNFQNPTVRKIPGLKKA